MRLLCFALALLFAAPALAAGPGPTEPAYLYRAQVTRVIDGDTVDVTLDLGFYIELRAQRIRLLGIDAPEVKGETREAGQAAKAFLKDLVEGRWIIIRTVKGKDDGDRADSFGRWLGVLYLDGVDVNEAMMAAGHAVPYAER